MKGTVLRIERISPNDGNGLRTVVFLKGCALHCAWCSTPESQKCAPEWSYRQAKCIHCSKCIRECPAGALSPSEDLRALVRDRDKCVNCFRCAEVCLTRAIDIYGKTMTVDEIVRDIRKDSLFYFHSKGGVTVSGGDILLQADFAAALLSECREECLDTAAEMDMFGPYENVKKILPHLCSCFVDIKHMDPVLHRKWTGVDNGSILANIRRASEEFPKVPLHARVPLVPGVNDDRDNLEATARFCAQLTGCRTLEFLPFHRLGAAAYQYTGRKYHFAGLEAMSFDEAFSRVGFLAEKEWPFTIKIAGRKIGPA